MAVNYKFNNGGSVVDFDDVFIRKDLFTAGGLWMWGYNNLGQLGDNTTANKSSPVQTISAGINWKQVTGGAQHSAGIKNDGTLWTWGRGNDFVGGRGGQLGDNTIVSKSSPVQTIASGTNWKQVAASAYDVAAIKTDGTLWLWGSNGYGSLGDNTIVSKSSPVQTVSAGSNWRAVALGYSETNAAIKTDGTLWLWGRNHYGQLGDNSNINKSSPVQTISGGTNWKQVVKGLWHHAAIKTDGTLWLWGRNNYGQLGDNTAGTSSSPVQTISAGTNWKQVSASLFSNAAIKTDGTLWLWGRNHYGQLGNNSTAQRNSPVQTVAGGTNWKKVSMIAFSPSALKTDGTLWLWGRNSYGQLGDNTVVQKNSPVQTVMGGNRWTDLASGTNHIGGIINA